MSPVKQASPKRTPTRAAGKGTQSPPIVRAMATEAFETWVVPTLAACSAALFWILSSLDFWPEPVAVVGIAGSLLVLSLFASFRGYVFAEDSLERRVSLVFVFSWGLFLFATFYRFNFPGAPIAVAELRRDGKALEVPSGGLYAVIVDGRFTTTEGRATRLGRYRLEASSAGRQPRIIDGSFEDRFGYQRVGRRGTAPVEYQHTSQRHVARLPDGTSLRVAEIDASLEPWLRVSLYPTPSPWIFTVLGVAGVLAALVLEKRVDGDGSATTATSATFCVVDQYLRWAAPHPQVKSLVGAVLVGSFIGAPVAALAWRMVPRRWIARPR
jgi:hypothetical protein